MNNNSVLILVNENKDRNLAKTKELINFISPYVKNIYAENSLSSRLNLLAFNNNPVDFAIVMGGDGTILNFAHKYKELNPPFFGINIGRVGCLAEGTMKNYQEKLLNIINNDYFIEERNVISCKLYDNGVLKENVVSFNEVAIHRGNLFKMLLINMEINEHNKTLFYADGVLVSTATGSSAYNLSCGGPLLLPSAKNFVITPIAPQLRTITSLVINDTEVITIDLHDDNKRQEYTKYHPVVSIDGVMQFEIDENSKIEISKSDKSLKIIKINKEASLFEPTFKVAQSTKKC